MSCCSSHRSVAFSVLWCVYQTCKVLLEPAGTFYNLRATLSLENLGLEHFYATFGVRGSRDLRSAAGRVLTSTLSPSQNCSVGMLSIHCIWSNIALLLAVFSHVVTITSPFSWSSLLLSFVFICIPLPFHRRGGLSRTSLWHIVRLVLLHSSIFLPLIYFNTPPQRPLSSTFFQTSPLGNLSYFKLYLVQWHSPHFDLCFHRFLPEKKSKLSS